MTDLHPSLAHTHPHVRASADARTAVALSSALFGGMRVGLIHSERGYGHGMPYVVVEVDTDVPPERMMEAATDFSERRPELWPNISREFWQLHDHGPNWAEATEGSPAVWARERYEWSDNRVVGTTQDSNVWQPGGTWTLTVEPRNGAGSHLRVILDRRWKGRGWLFYVPVALFGQQMFKRNLQKTLNVLAPSSR